MFEEIFGIFKQRPALTTSILTLVIATLVNLGIERTESKKKNTIAFIVALIALIITESLLIIMPLDSIDKKSAFYVFDNFARFFSVFAIFVTIAILVAVKYYSTELPEVPAFYSLITGTAIGLILLPSAVDLLSIFVAWELLSVPLYAMVAYSHNWSRSTEGAVKYYVMGTASSAILALGIGLTGAIMGTTNLYLLPDRFNEIVMDQFSLIVMGIAIVGLVGGFGVKITLVPLHQWAPDTYEGSMPPITAYLSGTIKAIRLSAPLRVFMVLAPIAMYDISVYLAILSFLTMTYANIVALKQERVYRMMAYSSISQVGYIVIGLVAAVVNSSVADIALTATIFYALAFAIMEVAVFIAIGVIMRYIGLYTIDDYNGLASKYPGVAIILGCGLLSLVGIPPFVGFAGKIYLFIAALKADILWLAIALAINSAISIGYYGLVVKRMFLEAPSEKIKEAKIPALFMAILWILTIAIIGLGVYPFIIEKYASIAATELI